MLSPRLQVGQNIVPQPTSIQEKDDLMWKTKSRHLTLRSTPWLHDTVPLLPIDVLIVGWSRQDRYSYASIVTNRFMAAILSTPPKALIDRSLMIWSCTRLGTIRTGWSPSATVPPRRGLDMVDAPSKKAKDIMNRVGFEPTRIAPLADSLINLKLAP